MDLTQLGNAIREFRQRLGFTQNDLASALQVSPQAVSKWERGENAPDIASLPAISEILGVSIDTLLGAHWRDDRTVNATVMFADMDKYSELAAGKEPAEIAISINTYFYALTEHVIAFDGIPVKYIGDSLLCVFAGDGHALRAVWAALAARRDETRPSHYALATGRVWMGAIGHPAYARPDVLGDTVNLAACLVEWSGHDPACAIAATAVTVDAAGPGVSVGKRATIDLSKSVRNLAVAEIVGVS